MIRAFKIATHVRRLGPRVFAEELRTRLLSGAVYFGLRCNLEQLPPLRPASIPITLERCDGAFEGFEIEVERTTGADYASAVRRLRWHQMRVPTLYVAWDPDRSPAYVQWLVTSSDEQVLDEHASRLWPTLKEDEVVLEYAYTFTPFRGLGIMGDAMGRLLRVGAALGAKSALTYVRSDNTPSLRGCARVGFGLDHARTMTISPRPRPGAMRAPSEAERHLWQQATASRQQG